MDNKAAGAAAAETPVAPPADGDQIKEQAAKDADKKAEVKGGDENAEVKDGDKKAELKEDEAKKLVQFMGSKFEEHVANAGTFDEFYHAVFHLIEMFCEERGQVQYRIPKTDKLRQAYNNHHKTSEKMTKEEFMKISKEVVSVHSFSFGKATTDFLVVLFGGPICALAAMRILPGLGWLSEDLVIPLATSGSVAYLIRSKKI